MKRLRRPVIRFGAVILAAVLCFVGGVWVSHHNAVPVISSKLISQSIEEISQLAVVDYRYTNVGKFENRVDFYGWKVPLTMKRFIIAYDGEIKAGIDMSQADVKLRGNKIDVTLPKAKILSHDIDTDSIQVFDETKNIFNPITITDYVTFSKDQKQKLEQQAIEKGLLAEAQTKAENTVRNWLTAVAGENEYEINITVSQ